MATESITHNFYFEGEAAERFMDALDEAWDAPKRKIDVNVRELHGEELWEFMKKAAEVNGKR